MAMRTISREMVKPNEPTWNGKLPLTELDHISVITHSSNVFFYAKPTTECWLNPSNNKIFNTLKDSLSRILVPFYPLAGRLSWLAGRLQRLVLECNAMDAYLIEVESKLKIADFGDFYSSSEKLQHLVPQMDYFLTPIQNIPLLAVQITRFMCGGLSVGVSMSHLIVDGRSAFHFVDEWARLARGEPVHVAPFLNRYVLQEQDEEALSNTKVDDESKNVNYFNGTECGKLSTPTFVLLTKDKIDWLKKVANSDKEITNKNGRVFSRFEVITSHIWRCVCMARELKCEDITSLFVLVDVRGRTDPPLPSSYFGNAVVDMKISSFARELISKPLSFACNKIREAISKLNDEYVMEYIEFLKDHESLTKFQYIDDRGILQGPSYGDHNMMPTSWLNLVATNVDFGWGNESKYTKDLL